VEERNNEENKKKELYLEVARMLKLGAPVSEISRALRISGHTIKDVRRLIEAGYITYSENGEPTFVGDIREAEMYLAQYSKLGRSIRRSLTPESITPESIVAATIQEKTAEEARNRVEAKLTVGEVAIYILEQLRKDGFDPEQYPPEKIIPEMYKAWKELPTIKKRLEEAIEALNFYRSRTHPIVRLEQGIQMLKDFLEMALLMDALGIDIIDSDVGRYYANLIQSYLVGIQPQNQNYKGGEWVE